jgi:hypothetical protein
MVLAQDADLVVEQLIDDYPTFGRSWSAIVVPADKSVSGQQAVWVVESERATLKVKNLCECADGRYGVFGDGGQVRRVRTHCEGSPVGQSEISSRADVSSCEIRRCCLVQACVYEAVADTREYRMGFG